MSAARARAGGEQPRAGGEQPRPGRAQAAAPAPGPVVAVCTGHRCAGLRRLGGGEVLDEGLRSAVRASAGGVLISCPCLGRCEQGPVTVVGHHDGATSTAGAPGTPGAAAPTARTPMVWLRESSDPAWRAALEAWVVRGVTREPPRSGSGGDAPCPVVRVPGALRGAVVGHSVSSPLRRLPEPPTTPDPGPASA